MAILPQFTATSAAAAWLKEKVSSHEDSFLPPLPRLLGLTMPEANPKDINAFLIRLTGMHGDLIAVLASAWGAPYPLDDLAS